MRTIFMEGLLGAGIGLGQRGGPNAFARTGWGLLEPVQESEGAAGFAETGWGMLRRVRAGVSPRPQLSPVLFGAGGGFVGGPVPLRGMGQRAKPPGRPPRTWEAGVPPATLEPPPEAGPRPIMKEYRPDRFRRLLLRLCSIMGRFRDEGVPEEARSRVFWSYVRHSRQPDEMVVSAFQEICPDVPVPPKPARPPKELRPERPEQAGFRGKTTISYAEARELLGLLDEVLKPVTPEEASSEIAERECLRELNEAGAFPVVEDLRDRLAEFAAAGDTGQAFTISHGEVVVTGKAVECAAALGRRRAVRTVAAAGGAAAGGGLLLLLLGVL